MLTSQGITIARPREFLSSLLEDFRYMVNGCVRMELKEIVSSMKSLSNLCQLDAKKLER